MKKLVLLIGIFFTQTLLLSNPVPEDTILQVATNWLELQTGQPHTSNDCVAYPNISNPSYWRVNFNPGFVIVSADNSCIPILAFSTQSNYPLQNEAAEDLLLEYSLQIEDAKNNNRSNADTLPIWNAILNQTISIAEQHDIGFETPQWSGNGPYNNYCPWDNHNLIDGHHQRSLVGCVATACAQICNYYKRWNYTLVDSDRYTSNNYNFECAIDLDAAIHDFPDFTNLNGYLDEVVYKYNNNIPLTDSDKAALSFACGILVHIQYSSPASSGGHGGLAYTKLNMHCQLAEASSYTSETWINLIKNQLELNRPVEYHGQRTDVWGGHAYIITGFQTTNMNTTLNLVNWGRHWRLLEYWSLQPINPANDYPVQHSMLYGIAPNASVNQTIQLVNGSTDYSGIHIYAAGHDGVSKTLTTDNGVFEFGLPLGTYDFTITDIGNYYFPIQICDISIQTGTNYISPDPIVLTLKPNVVVVPTDVPTIPEAIDLVRNGGTVAIRNGSYTVSGLNWQDKHIKLQGQSQSGVIITNDPDSGLPAIQLSGIGIDNQDLISNVTFSNCDLTGTGTVRRGAAIELRGGAAPIITNCTFNQNRVGNFSSGTLIAGSATGGAVHVSGNGATSQTNNTPRFVNCTFTNNYTLNGNGGGAVALYGKAQFTGCEFTNNQTIITDGIENPISRDMGGAVFIYTRVNRYDIDIEFDNCLFNNNKGRSEADDVFVANIVMLNTLRFNGCTFTADTPHLNGAKPAVKFSNDTDYNTANMHAHLILTDNKFLSCRQGAVYFCDYYGKNSLTFTGNVVANNMYEGYGVYSWYPDGTSPTQSNYFAFNNNTFSNITGSGLILYQSPPTTVNNTVFENCSTNGICWGDYEEGHQDWVTRGLTTNHCLFSSSIPRYDFAGNTSSPLVENSVISVQVMNLDNSYRPIWTASTMSPCIDAGYGDYDPDGTPPDIGAKTAQDHAYWTYSFENQADYERWHWVSYPVLNTLTDNAMMASEFFEELLIIHLNSNDEPTPTYLDKIDWMEEGNSLSLEWLDDEHEWTPNQDSHFVFSPQGYKIRLLQNVPDTVTLIESGFKTPENLQFPINGGVENWLGYFKEAPAKPNEVFADIWDDIIMVRGKSWGLVRDSNGLLTGKMGTLHYGDMVSILTTNNHTFQWGSSNPTPPDVKSMPQHFAFHEKQDYIPIYVSLPDSLMPDLKEIGLYLDGICKGAVVVESDYEQISAYVDSEDELTNSDLELVLHYDESKRPDQELRTTSYSPGKMQTKYGISGARYPFYEISISQKDLDNVKPPVFALKQNYPNPFNPSTSISYWLPETARVRLDIYNLKGQLVKTLIDSEMAAGPHSLVWNGKDSNNQAVASGVYFYRISSPKNTQTKRMLLMK